MCNVMFYIGNFIEDFIARMSAYLRLLSTPSILVHVVSIIYISIVTLKKSTKVETCKSSKLKLKIENLKKKKQHYKHK